MQRRPDISAVQLTKFRIDRPLHRDLEQAAKRNHQSLSREIRHRLAQSFEQPALFRLTAVAQDVERMLVPLLDRTDADRAQAELIAKLELLLRRLARLLAARLIGGPEATAARVEIDAIQRAIIATEQVNARRFRRLAKTEEPVS
jgi:hypothetical protein